MKKFFYSLTALTIVLFLASCGGEKAEEQLTDPQITAKINVEIGHLASMATSAFNPVVPNQLVASSYDESLILWDYETQHQIWVYRPEFDNNDKDFSCLYYTSDGKKIVASAAYALMVFDAENGSVLKDISIKNYGGKNLSLSPDNKIAALGDYDGEVHLIDINSGETIKTLKEQDGSIQCLDYDEEGKYLASASYDSLIVVWDLETGNVLKKIKLDKKAQNVVISSKYNKLAFVINDTDELHIWDFKKMKEIKVVPEVFAKQIMLRGENLMVKNLRTTNEISLTTGEVVRTLEDYCWNMAMLDNKLSVVSSKGIEVYDYDEGKLIAEFGAKTRIPDKVKVSESGRFILTSNSHQKSSVGPDVLSYPVDTNYKFSSYESLGFDAGTFCLAGREDVILSSLEDANYYDLKSGKATSKIKKVQDPLVITHDGTLLIAKDDSKNYNIYDAKTGEQKTKLVYSDDYSVDFAGVTPDDKYYVLQTNDFCKVFELPSGKEVKSYGDDDDMDYVHFVDMNKDGKYVLGRGKYDFTLVDILTGEILFMIEDIEFYDAALSKDKNTVALGCEDWKVRVYDMTKMTQIHTLEGHNGTINGLTYTPDGKRLISTAEDGQTKIWDAATGNLLLTLIGLEKLEDYEEETKDFLVLAPNGRYDGSEKAIEKFIYFEENGQKKPAKDFKEQCYTPNLLGKTLGQKFIETTPEK